MKFLISDFLLVRSSNFKNLTTKMKRTLGDGVGEETHTLAILDKNDTQCMICRENMYTACCFQNCGHMVCVECAFTLFTRQIHVEQVACDHLTINIEESAYALVYLDTAGNQRSIKYNFEKLKCPMCRDESDSFYAAPKFFDNAIDSMYSRNTIKKRRCCTHCNKYMISSAEHYMHFFTLSCPRLKYPCPYESCGKTINLSPDERSYQFEHLMDTNLNPSKSQHQLMVAASSHFATDCTGWMCFESHGCDFRGTVKGSVIHGKIHQSLMQLETTMLDLRQSLNDGMDYYNQMQGDSSDIAKMLSKYIAGPVGIDKYADVLDLARQGVWNSCVKIDTQ